MFSTNLRKKLHILFAGLSLSMMLLGPLTVSSSLDPFDMRPQDGCSTNGDGSCTG